MVTGCLLSEQSDSSTMNATESRTTIPRARSCRSFSARAMLGTQPLRAWFRTRERFACCPGEIALTHADIPKGTEKVAAWLGSPVGTARATPGARPRGRLSDYICLLKPRVMSLVVFTGWVGLYLAPGRLDLLQASIAVLSIAVGSGAAGCIN